MGSVRIGAACVLGQAVPYEVLNLRLNLQLGLVRALKCTRSRLTSALKFTAIAFVVVMAVFVSL